MEIKISPWGLEEAKQLAKRFNLDEASMIAARALLEQQQAAANAEVNARIRAAAGYGSTADPAQPEPEPAPPKLASAHAGNGSNQPGVGTGETTAQRMNRFIRNRGRGDW